MSVLFQTFGNFWHYTKEAAPWLLLGFLFAGLLRAFVPKNLVLKHLGKRDIKSILRATLVGIPLPLCSCGVIPAGLGLFKQGASRASTLAFFIATPATTITTILISFGMLGWKFTLAEIILVFCVAIGTGFLALFFLKDEPRRIERLEKNEHNFRIREVFTCQECEREFKERIKTTFRFGFIDMIDDIGLYILIGLLGAGIIAALLSPAIVNQYLGRGLLPLIIMVLIGAPMYICSAASVPFVAALVAKGMHPCAGLVFLIVGPATNLSTMLAIGRSMGKRAVFLYVSSIIGLSILIAYSFDLVGWL